MDVLHAKKQTYTLHISCPQGLNGYAKDWTSSNPKLNPHVKGVNRMHVKPFVIISILCMYPYDIQNNNISILFAFFSLSLACCYSYMVYRAYNFFPQS